MPKKKNSMSDFLMNAKKRSLWVQIRDEVDNAYQTQSNWGSFLTDVEVLYQISRSFGLESYRQLKHNFKNSKFGQKVIDRSGKLKKSMSRGMNGTYRALRWAKDLLKQGCELVGKGSVYAYESTRDYSNQIGRAHV